jgi:hypothetical protein
VEVFAGFQTVKGTKGVAELLWKALAKTINAIQFLIILF